MKKVVDVADKIIPKIAIPLIVFAGMLVITLTVNEQTEVGNNTNAYIRVIECIVSQDTTTHNQADVENCYTTVEKNFNIKLQRYYESN